MSPDDLTFGSANILVAVVDSGVESMTDGMGVVTPAHPEFQGTVTNGQSKVDGFFDFGDMVANNNNPDSEDHGTGVLASPLLAPTTLPLWPVKRKVARCGAELSFARCSGNLDQSVLKRNFQTCIFGCAGFDPGSPDPAFPPSWPREPTSSRTVGALAIRLYGPSLLSWTICSPLSQMMAAAAWAL